MRAKKFFVGSEPRESNEIIEITNPYNKEVYCKVYNAQKNDFEEGINKAQKAFEKTISLSKIRNLKKHSSTY